MRLHRLDAPSSVPFDLNARQRVDELASDRRIIGSRLDDAHAASASNALQVHNRYLVVETDAGIEVIDQHALHERILYEQLREKVLGGALESQKLLVPEPVDLTATESAAALEHSELLAQLGVEVQPFGGETVLVSSYPAMLANLSPAEVLRELVEKLLVGGRQPDARDLLDELLHMIACKAAVKFGDRLSDEEIDVAAGPAAPGPGPAPLPARPADFAGFHPRRPGPAVQADLIRGHRSTKIKVSALADPEP